MVALFIHHHYSQETQGVNIRTYALFSFQYFIIIEPSVDCFEYSLSLFYTVCFEYYNLNCCVVFSFQYFIIIDLLKLQ